MSCRSSRSVLPGILQRQCRNSRRVTGGCTGPDLSRAGIRDRMQPSTPPRVAHRRVVRGCSVCRVLGVSAGCTSHPDAELQALSVLGICKNQAYVESVIQFLPLHVRACQMQADLDAKSLDCSDKVYALLGGRPACRPGYVHP